MIGYYAHHHGSGHVHRAMAIAAELEDDVTILSSAERPAEWEGDWVGLPLDTDIASIDQNAGGIFHFAPVGSEGLSSRMAAISHWVHATKPSVVVVDVSVEVASLIRLHGVRVVVIAQPGLRIDTAHTLGYRLADAIVGCWPAAAHPWEADESVAHRLEAVGGLSRIAVDRSRPRPIGRLAVLRGRGSRGALDLDVVTSGAQKAFPDARWTMLEQAPGAAVASALRDCEFVISHCGQNAVAEIAASRVPAVLVPERRPFDEQLHLGRALASLDLPVRILLADDHPDWASLRAELSRGSTERWSAWVDGFAAGRAARVVERVASRHRVAA